MENGLLKAKHTFTRMLAQNGILLDEESSISKTDFENHQYLLVKAFVYPGCFTILFASFSFTSTREQRKKNNEEDRFDLKSTSHEIAHMTNRNE